MTINGKAFTTTRTEFRAQNPAVHPPIVVGAPLKANDGVYPLGLILKRDVDGATLIPAAEGDTPAAVLDEQIDTATQGSGNVVLHGGLVLSELKVGAADPAAPTAAMVRKLQVAGLFPA